MKNKVYYVNKVLDAKFPFRKIINNKEYLFSCGEFYIEKKTNGKLYY